MSKHCRPALYLAAAFGVWSLAFAPASGRQVPSSAAVQPPAQDPSTPPTFKAGINFVRVDVIATDKDGKPVVNLKPSDFKVREDGRLQRVQTFQLVRIAQPGREAEGPIPPAPIHNQYEADTEGAKDNVRLVAIFLDDYHVRLGNSMAVRQPLETFVEQDLGQKDLVGLMYPLTPIDAISLTTNHAAVAKEIGEFVGRKYNYDAKNSFEERYATYPTNTVEQIRNQASLSALRRW